MIQEQQTAKSEDRDAKTARKNFNVTIDQDILGVTEHAYYSWDLHTPEITEKRQQ